ncbi:adenylate/guanylate cyclase domain-containing protein [Acidovorax sp. sic0104]|uniref:adenylate/guanylate cyclase domain-containing protein n=1 Tax=Acidovorax sp. sic0104 TaxID=2854784 RepID=UPI001C48A75C|nr:adenylate/guanylate cyclase domain-containing protein [Acidovorax sp. sic0104]MBV7543596.1 adenylate/guanylate cyclase domain-containing protein [Acidovorax sp. sic0104]
MTASLAPNGLEGAWQSWGLRVLAALLLLAFLWLLPLWTPLARLEYDLLSSLTAPVRPDAGVLVVGIDEPSLAELNLSPPLPRSLHARMLGAVSAAGAAAVGVDLLFASAQTAADDAALGSALQGRMPVVLASAEVTVQSSQVAHYRQGVPSLFTQARHGSVAVDVDDDGVLRRAPAQGDAFWRVLAQSAGRPVTAPPPGALMRHYAPEVPLPYAHYSQVLEPGQSLPPGALKGRLVLVGQNTPVGGVDQFTTPQRLRGAGTQSGVFMHATALINGLTGDWIVPAHPAGPALQAVLAVAFAAWATRVWRGWRAGWLTVALSLLALIGAFWAYLVGVWWSALPTLAGLLLHLNVGAAGSYWRERRRREQLRSDFARYVPPAVVDALAAAGTAPAAVQGERRVLTLLFSDLAGFTAASENLPPEAVAQALNAYFTRMTRCVHQHGGTLDKFIGDAVMAFWNAPLPEPAHAARALACAEAMQADMVALRTEWQGTPFGRVLLRIGLHTGEAAVGHLGSHERFTYTAVGDAVNTAARLEGANKAFGTSILLSAAMRDALPAGGNALAHLLWVDAVVLAGRSAGIDVYTPCDDAVLVEISLALRGHLHAGDWAQALQCCVQWHAHAGQHAPQWLAHTVQLRDRVQARMNEPPSAQVPTVFGARALDKS